MSSNYNFTLSSVFSFSAMRFGLPEGSVTTKDIRWGDIAIAMSRALPWTCIKRTFSGEKVEIVRSPKEALAPARAAYLFKIPESVSSETPFSESRLNVRIGSPSGVIKEINWTCEFCWKIFAKIVLSSSLTCGSKL